MNKYQAKKLLPIIEAFANGEQIQTIAQVNTTGMCMWVDTNEPRFETASEFRIKPKRIYRPFQNAEECWEEMQKHQPFGWLKTDEGYEQIWHVNKGDDFSATLKHCTFADGTPFGIKEG